MCLAASFCERGLERFRVNFPMPSIKKACETCEGALLIVQVANQDGQVARTVPLMRQSTGNQFSMQPFMSFLGVARILECKPQRPQSSRLEHTLEFSVILAHLH